MLSDNYKAVRPDFKNVEYPKRLFNKYFGYKHLPEALQERSKIFHDAATKIIDSNPVDYNQAILALELLVQAKDAYVRSFIPE